MLRRQVLLLTALSCALLGSCQNAMYSIREAFGEEKRDILVGRIRGAQEDQASAQEQFQTTLEALKALTGTDGGELEEAYDRLKSEYQRSEARANAVRARIRTVEDVAGDMFTEWDQEIGEITDANLRSKSEARLRETRERYQSMADRMNAAAGRMDPLLETFNNQVLYLKHELNAQMIGDLEGVVVDLENEVDVLVADLQKAIEEADEFINRFD
jgi:ElaB/YqjD/DUF883 family membrane-anchored ribosome-binding protein